MNDIAYLISGWVSIAIWLCIYLPLSLYGMYLFYKYRFVSVIRKRHVNITLIVLLFCLTQIGIDRVLWIVYICNISTSSIFNISSILTYPIILYGLLYSLLWRFWIIRYDIQFVRATMNNKWRSIINEEYIEQNWYLTNRSKWGSSKYVALYTLLPIYTVCTISSIIIRLQIYTASNNHELYNSEYVDLWIIDMTMSIIPYFIIVYLWLKTPGFHDTFWIRDATKLIFIVLFILFTTNIIFGLFALYLKYQFVLLSLIESHIMCAANLSIIIIMTYLVFYKNKSSFAPQQQLSAMIISNQPSMLNNDSNNNHNNNNNNDNNIPNIPQLRSAQSTESNTVKKHKQISLKYVLKDSIMFHAFMTHLATEFSMECLLAIVEFTEYEEYCIDNFNDYLSTKYNYRSKLIVLPSDTPKSLIVYGSKSERTPKKEDNKNLIAPILNRFAPSLSHSNKSKSSQQQTPSMGAIQHSASMHNKAPSMPRLALQPALSGTTQSNPMDVTPIQIDRNSSGSNKKRRSKVTKGLYGDLKPFQTKAKLLYDKYIGIGAPYEINISYSMRNEFNEMLNNDELWSSVFDHSSKNRNKLQNEKIISERLHQILTLLNRSINEMIKLLSHSFTRFMQTPTYHKLIQRQNKYDII